MELEKESYTSPRWTYEILDCAMPMTFDTYSNCAHQCLYCFSFFQRAVGARADDYLHHKVKAVNVEKIKKMFLNPDRYAGQFKAYIKKRMVLQWGGLSDGFDFYEKKFGKSLELLRFFREIDYPLSISTKGVWYVYDERYREVLKDAKNVQIKYSIITDNEEHVKALEPGVPPAKERFRALAELTELGIGATTLRFRPFTLGTSDKCVDSMFRSAKDAGCYSVTTEFLTWESRASVTSRQRLDMMSKTLGYDVWDFYMKNSARASGLLRLNYDLKRPYIKQMKETAESLDLKFFVSDAHHKEDSYHAGCCGLPETGPLSNVNRGQYAHAILLAKKNGFVKWSDIAEEAKEVLNSIPVYAAEGFPNDSDTRAARRYQSMFDYMHDIWNNPKGWQSPARYFGGALVPSNLDNNGDIIYLYNKPFIEDEVRVKDANELAVFLRMSGKDNAERFDEMSADGTDFGHIAYDIYVFSRSRQKQATTMKLLEKQRINYNLVVREVESTLYADEYPNANIIVLPPEADTIGQARSLIYEQAKEQGASYIWMLDDDVSSLTKRDGTPTTFRALFSELEHFNSDYSNIALLGVDIGNNPDNQSHRKFIVNNEVRGVMLVNILTGNPFVPWMAMLEDVEFALKNLETGKWVTVTHNGYKVEFNAAIGGGMAKEYNVDGNMARYAAVLYQQYPQHIYIDDAPAPWRGVPRVLWQTFPNVLQSRNVELLLEGAKNAE